MKRSKISHKLAAVATMGIIAASSSDAHANATNFADMSNNIVTASSGFQNMISTVCWLGGAGLGVAGIFKLKQHVDNPGQTPMKDGLVRIGAGGGLLAFPFIQNAMSGSIADGQTDALDGAVLKMDSSADLFGT